MKIAHALTTLALGAVLVLAPTALPSAGAATAPLDTAAQAALAASDTTATSTKLWTAAWMGNVQSYSSTASLDLAKRSSVIAAMPQMFKPYVAQMKAQNPALQLVVYKNATFGDSSYPESMYAHDALGRRIHATDWPTTYLMNLADTRWATEVARKCALLIRASTYDGCFLDVLGSGPLTAPAYLSAQPVSNGNQWTPNQWIGWTADIVRAVRSGNPGKLVMGNGLGNGDRYFDTTQDPRPLVPLLDAVMPELFLRVPSDSATRFPDETTWKRNVDMVIDAESRGGAALTMTKMWVNATVAQRNAWHRYALASFLLGTNGASKFCFLSDHSANAPLMTHSYDRVDIGAPAGAYRQVGRYYVRTFSGGMAVVNPTSSPVAVSLSKPYVTLDGTRVSGTITLPATSGDVLKG